MNDTILVNFEIDNIVIRQSRIEVSAWWTSVATIIARRLATDSLLPCTFYTDPNVRRTIQPQTPDAGVKKL